MPGSRSCICDRGEVSRRLWFSSGRSSYVSGPAFSGLLADSFSGPCLGVIASWRRVNQQFKVAVLYVVRRYRYFSFICFFLGKQGRGTKLGRAGFPGLRSLAVHFWRDQLEASVTLRLGCGVGDNGWAHNERRRFGHRLLLRDCTGFSEAIQATGCADGKALPARWKKCVTIWRRNLARNLLIADARDRASEISFLSTRQTGGRARSPAGLYPRIAGHGKSVLLLAAL